MRIDRLRDTAEATRNAAEFDIGNWCGTACCAVGNYVLAHPESELQMSEPPLSAPTYKGIWDYGALMSFYEISCGEMAYLFLPDSYAPSVRQDAQYVAARIEAFIRDHRESPVIEMKPSAVAPVAARKLEGESV